MLESFIAPENIILVFTLLAIFSFSFVYWKDATTEGFSSDKIFDSIFLILMGGFLGGKLLFRPVDLSYLRYEFLNSPIILEGALVGGGLMLWISVYKNQWSGWKMGDMIAPALSLFQAIVFLGVYLVTRRNTDLILFTSFILLYLLIRYLKNSKSFGKSAMFFERKRLNKIVYTGALLTIYLTVSSLIAILFLISNRNLQAWFWWFQFSFYTSVFVVTVVLVRAELSNSPVSIMSLKDILKSLNVLEKLRRREKEIQKEKKLLTSVDPFTHESKIEGGRVMDEQGDEVMEQDLHSQVERGKGILNQEEKEVKEALKRIKEGNYGICQNCGKPISKERLHAYPTAKFCIDCEKKLSVK